MPIALRPVSRASTLALALALLLGFLPLSAGPVRAQDATAATTGEPVWNLIPGNATGLIAINADPESEQWQVASGLLQTAGLSDVAVGLFDRFAQESGLAPATFDSEQSSILGGTIVAAGWGDGSDPLAHGALYVAAPNPEAAYRSLAAQFLTETDPDAIEVEIPGGRVTTDLSGSVAVMLLNDVVVITDRDGGPRVAGLVTGAGPALGQFEPFNRVMDAQRGDLLALIYANGPAAAQVFGGSLAGLFGLGYQEIALYQALSPSVNAFHTSMGLSATEDGFLLRTAQLPAPIIGPDLPANAPSNDLAAQVSGRSDLFIAGADLSQNPQFAQLIDTIVITAASGWASYPGPIPPDIRTWAYDEVQRRTGIDLRADLLDQIKGDYVIAAEVDSTDQWADTDLVIRTDLDDAETVADTIGKLATLLRVATSDLGDESDQADLTETFTEFGALYTLTVRDSGQEIAFSFGVLDEQLVAAMGDGMDLLIEEQAASLANDARYQDTLAKLPEEDGAPFYLDLQNLITMAGLTSIDAPAAWGLPAGRQITLGGLRSLAGMTYAEDGLARTDLLLDVSETMQAPSAQPGSEGPDATPIAVPGAALLTVADATAFDVGNRFVFSISPDGSRVVVMGATDLDEICVVTLDGSIADVCTDQILSIDDFSYAWSPDSALVSLTEDSAQFLHESDIWVIDVEAGEVRNLTDDGMSGTLPLNEDRSSAPPELTVDFSPIFTPDGSAIVFSRSFWSAEEPTTTLYRVGLDGGEPEPIARLGSEPFLTWNGAVWVDLQTLLISYASIYPDDPGNGLWTVDIETGVTGQIWNGEGAQDATIPLVQRPDGKIVVTRSSTRFGFDPAAEPCPAAVIDPARGETTPIKDGNGGCALLLGVAPRGSAALVSAGPDYGGWIVDLNNFTASEFDLEPIKAAESEVSPGGFVSLTDMEGQLYAWSADNELVILAGITSPVRVTLESSP